MDAFRNETVICRPAVAANKDHRPERSSPMCASEDGEYIYALATGKSSKVQVFNTGIPQTKTGVTIVAQ